MNKDIPFGTFVKRIMGTCFTVEVKTEMSLSHLAPHVVIEVGMPWNYSGRSRELTKDSSQVNVGPGPAALSPQRYIITYKSMSKEDFERFEEAVAAQKNR
jgi:hypothetical protein